MSVLNVINEPEVLRGLRVKFIEYFTSLQDEFEVTELLLVPLTSGRI